MSHRMLLVVQLYPDGGGISSILENYVTELTDDHEVHVAIVEERPAARERLALPPEQVHVLGYSNAINPMVMPTSLAYAGWIGLRLRRLVHSLEPSAVITQDALNLPVPALIASAGSQTRVVVMDHGTLTNVHEDAWLPMLVRRLGPVKGRVFQAGFVADAPWRRARWRLARRMADELWYTGEELAPWFDRANGRAKRYAQTVPRDFVPPTAAERAAAREQLGVDRDITLVNYVGRLDGEKGLDTIVAAVANAEPTGGWQLLVAGDGSLQSWLQAATEERGIGDRVRLLGRLGREHVRMLQFASDFHLYAGTISCGVSICLLEAMAAGVIPIVSDVPRIQRELVNDAGWVFPAGDATALERALGEALRSGQEERVRRRARVLEQIRQQTSPTVPQLVRSLLRQPATLPERHGR